MLHFLKNNFPLICLIFAIVSFYFSDLPKYGVFFKWIAFVFLAIAIYILLNKLPSKKENE